MRSWKLGLSGLTIALLIAGYAWLAATKPIGWRQCVLDPAGCDETPLIFSLYTVTDIEGPQRYRIAKVVRDVPVEGPTTALAVGDVLSVAATFRAADQVAVENHREKHVLRPYKKWLSALALLWALWMAPRCFAWRSGRLWERG